MHKLILKRIIKILAHSEIIEPRSKNIHSPDFFIGTEQGEAEISIISIYYSKIYLATSEDLNK